jgi:hypothetical protein
LGLRGLSFFPRYSSDRPGYLFGRVSGRKIFDCFVGASVVMALKAKFAISVNEERCGAASMVRIERAFGQWETQASIPRLTAQHGDVMAGDETIEPF